MLFISKKKVRNYDIILYHVCVFKQGASLTLKIQFIFLAFSALSEVFMYTWPAEHLIHVVSPLFLRNNITIFCDIMSLFYDIFPRAVTWHRQPLRRTGTMNHIVSGKTYK